MPKFKISATDVRQGGITVGEVIVEKVGRQQALDEGISELLHGPGFAPEAGQLYDRAIMMQADRGDLTDEMLGKFGLQFFCVEAKDVAAHPPLPVLQGPSEAAPVPPPHLPPAQSNGHVRSPRQLIKDELARINKELLTAKLQKAQMDKAYNNLKERRDECAELLKPRKPAPKGITRAIARD